MYGETADLIAAVRKIEAFVGREGLTARIAGIESAVQQCDGSACGAHATAVGVSSELLAAGYTLKRAAAQVNVLIHAAAVLLLVPRIVEPNERVTYVSLGAGNTGRAFDLETNLRVAEFKFIHWQGRDTIRQNSLFKDFYALAEHSTQKRKELYVLETDRPLRFLRGGRAISSVLSRNVKLLKDFKDRYGDRFNTVGEYYASHCGTVSIIDASPRLPELSGVAAAEKAEADAVDDL